MRRFMPPGPGVFPAARRRAVWCIRRAAVGSPVRHLRVTARIKISSELSVATCARAKAQFGLLWPPWPPLCGLILCALAQMHPPSGLGASERRANASFHFSGDKFCRRRQQPIFCGPGTYLALRSAVFSCVLTHIHK